MKEALMEIKQTGCRLLVFVLILVCSCSHQNHHTNLKDTYKNYDGVIQEPEAGRLTERIDKFRVEEKGATFWVTTREPHLTRFPCSQCHQNALPLPEQQAAHWDVTLNHGDQVMDCKTCHGAEQNMMGLRSLLGEPIAFDRSFDLCGQCHFQQRADWRGGAHGKREAAWAGERVIRNCTACHNPHEPRFHTRWPKVTPGPINITPQH
jgi:Zn-finger protein